jgi:hypothetical protein
MNDEFGNDGSVNDQGWELLRANDPANLSAAPDLTAIRASVLAESSKVVAISKRSWLAPVAVAASVALFIGGGAGYTIAAQSSSDSSNFVYTPTSAPEMGAPTGSRVGGANGSAAGMPSGAQDKKISASGAWAGWGGRPFLEASSDISDTAGKQVGFTFDASDIDRKAQLELIAAAFGIKGKITGSKKDGYFVGDQNYVKAVAQISGASWDLSQLVTWNYSDSSVYPIYCDSGVASDKTSDVAPSAAVTTPVVMPSAVPSPTAMPSECALPSGVLPSDESALALAKEKFAALNFESFSAIWSVVDSGSQWGYNAKLAGTYKTVTAQVLVAGITSNQSWSMTIGPDNAIVNVAGFFTKFVPTAVFNTVGAKTAIERSQNALWTNLQPQEVYKEGQIWPMDLALGGNPNLVTRNKAGQPILSASIDRITISKAETSLITWYLNDGSSILLPAYLLSESNAADSRQWLQLAIADEYVDFN